MRRTQPSGFPARRSPGPTRSARRFGSWFRRGATGSAGGRWRPPILVRVLRRRAVYWGLVAALAMLVGFGVHGLQQRGAALVAGYGAQRAVVVATQDIPAGQPLQGKVQQRLYPLALVPGSALAEVSADAVASVELFAGDVVTSHRVRAAGDDGLVPLDHVAVAIPRSPITPPAATGDAVVLVVRADPLALGEPSFVDGTVVTDSVDQVVVSVPHAQLAVVSAGLSVGDVALALAPG